MISRIALRRLALRSSRSPELLPVLQDALLEAYPEAFESAIERVEEASRKNPDALLIVLFDVSSIGRRGRVLADERFPIIIGGGFDSPSRIARLYSRTMQVPLVVAYVK